MLQIKNLKVSVQDTKVIDGIQMNFDIGKNYCILWKNWSWKSSLAMTIMGHPSYEVQDGTIMLDDEDILDMEPDERAKAWIFLAFQTIPEVAWVKLFEFLRTIYNSRRDKKESFVSFKRIILPFLEELWIDKEFLRRDLNVWFSWGERRKIEILQVKLLEPTYIFLDEVDSGLDVDAFRSVATLLQEINSPENCFIIITHYFTILEYVDVNHVYVLQDWVVQKDWWKELAETIQKEWFWS